MYVGFSSFSLPPFCVLLSDVQGGRHGAGTPGGLGPGGRAKASVHLQRCPGLGSSQSGHHHSRLAGTGRAAWSGCCWWEMPWELLPLPWESEVQSQCRAEIPLPSRDLRFADALVRVPEGAAQTREGKAVSGPVTKQAPLESSESPR